MKQPDPKGPAAILATFALLASTLGSPLPAMGALSANDVESLRREFRSEIKSVRSENADSSGSGWRSTRTRRSRSPSAWTT